MRCISSLKEIPFDEKIAVTIGNFDGVHLGHQKLLNELRNNASSLGLKLVVYTFNPHPRKILCPNIQDFLLLDYGDKKKEIETLNVDYYLEREFNRDFSSLAPENFLDQEIFYHPGVKVFYMGHDFVFGANKAGDFEFAKQYGHSKNIQVEQMPYYDLEETIISSTLIRKALNRGRVLLAHQWLGRPYFLKGMVVKGEGRGRTIGFPTANLKLDEHLLIPLKGVYITQTHYKKMTYQSLTNIGFNPTFGALDKAQVETHLLDFDHDIYGESLKIEFLDRVRDECPFESVNELIAQIQKDVSFAKEFFQK